MTFDRQAKAALLVVSAALVVCGIGFRFAAVGAEAYFAKKPVPLRSPLITIPKRLGDWRASGEDVKLTAEIVEVLGTEYYLIRTYRRKDEAGRRSDVGVQIVYYTGLIDAVPHIPDRCFLAGGMVAVGFPSDQDMQLNQDAWEPDPKYVNQRTGDPYPLLTFAHHVTGRKLTVRMPVGEFKLRTSEFRGGDRPSERVYAGYFFIANGRATPSPDVVRSFAFDLKSRYAYYAKVQFTMAVPPKMGQEEFLEVIVDLAAELLPELMMCLPDWAEVEAGIGI